MKLVIGGIRRRVNMGRAKGFKVSVETKMKAHETRKKNKLGKIKNDPEYNIVELQITGKEKCGFDFWPEIRDTLRPIHQYALCKKIEQEVAGTNVWNDIKAIKIILQKYFILVKDKKASSKYIIKKMDKRSDPVKKEASRKRMTEYWEKKKANAIS